MQYFIFLGLNFLKKYNSSHILKLLEKVEKNMLQSFQKGQIGIFKTVVEKKIFVKMLKRLKL